jgi:hypothetical protein
MRTASRKASVSASALGFDASDGALPSASIEAGEAPDSARIRGVIRNSKNTHKTLNLNSLDTSRISGSEHRTAKKLLSRRRGLEGGWKGVGRGLEGGWKGVGVMFMLDIFENIDIQPLSLIKDFVKNLRAAVFSF